MNGHSRRRLFCSFAHGAWLRTPHGVRHTAAPTMPIHVGAEPSYSAKNVAATAKGVRGTATMHQIFSHIGARPHLFRMPLMLAKTRPNRRADLRHGRSLTRVLVAVLFGWIQCATANRDDAGHRGADREPADYSERDQHAFVGEGCLPQHVDDHERDQDRD
jgi:hypothetical protein